MTEIFMDFDSRKFMLRMKSKKIFSILHGKTEVRTFYFYEIILVSYFYLSF